MESPGPFINAVLIFLLEIMLSINILTYVCQRGTDTAAHALKWLDRVLRWVLQHNIQKTHLFS